MKLVFAPSDFDGLAAAATALLRQAAQSQGPRQAGARTPVPLACEMWLAHLFALEELISVAPLAPEALAEAEARGLAILRRAREKFRSEHFPCRCGAILPNWAGFCSQCGQRFRRQSGAETIQ